MLKYSSNILNPQLSNLFSTSDTCDQNMQSLDCLKLKINSDISFKFGIDSESLEVYLVLKIKYLDDVPTSEFRVVYFCIYFLKKWSDNLTLHISDYISSVLGL